MLLIKTYLDTSGIDGIGLFAGEDIPHGKIIWEFNPYIDLVYSNEKWKELKNNINEYSYSELEKHTYKSNGKFYLSIDNSQFMNHGINNRNIANNMENDTMFAVRDIKKGEELICDYSEFCDEDDPCMVSFINGLNHD